LTYEYETGRGNTEKEPKKSVIMRITWHLGAHVGFSISWETIMFVINYRSLIVNVGPVWVYSDLQPIIQKENKLKLFKSIV